MIRVLFRIEFYRNDPKGVGLSFDEMSQSSLVGEILQAAVAKIGFASLRHSSHRFDGGGDMGVLSPLELSKAIGRSGRQYFVGVLEI